MRELRLDRLTIEYPARDRAPAYRAVEGVSLTAAPGEFVSVVGPSGCGKTSLLHAVAGLVPAAAGTVSLGGRPIRGPGPERAVVFQHASLLPWRTVLGNVAYGLELRRVPRREARARAREMVELVGLGEAATRYPHELSGGMQQRVNLARALAPDPAVLLMDEPFAALDAQTRDAMQAELLRIWAASRTSVLFVTHHIEEAVFLSDRVVVLSPGPGATVRGRVPVPFERPRETALRRTPEFVALADHVWSTLARARDREPARVNQETP
ncbi:ABC transporter ATP-binding protein [Phytohabitans suffuscus]|uniref:Nitrate ABC transporter ATP-binding protein n=1 Tax=Phytohabitans suffuscus TaxID=624315 RepID=A0A6F8YFC3_9ACTN|nr:ABC transporter ATP-binding protein [Phytohabitans suffuscus]BCB84834.1 nitrate ABC transporter ATP-binding protein [Phytohabitans suffuscus]